MQKGNWLEMVGLPIKKVITEVLLILSLYVILFVISLRFGYVIKMMADVENILNNEEFFWRCC